MSHPLSPPANFKNEDSTPAVFSELFKEEENLDEEFELPIEVTLDRYFKSTMFFNKQKRAYYVVSQVGEKLELQINQTRTGYFLKFQENNYKATLRFFELSFLSRTRCVECGVFARFGKMFQMCPKCQVLVFCSRDCQKKAWDEHHHQVCTIWSNIRKFYPSYLI